MYLNLPNREAIMFARERESEKRPMFTYTYLENIVFGRFVNVRL